MNILVITTLSPRQAGNQSLNRTLNGLAEAGHIVHVLSIRPPGEVAPQYSQHPDVHFHYRRLMPGWLRRVWLPLRSTLCRLERSLTRRSRAKQARGREVWASPPLGRSYMPFWPETTTLRIISKVVFWLVLIVGLYRGFRMARKYKPDLFYGYEHFGVPPAFLLAKLFRRPNVSRFQGVGSLYPLLQGNRRGSPNSYYSTHLKHSTEP